MARVAANRVRKSVQFWVLAFYLIFVFLVGGGARSDILSLIVLRPVSVLVCGFALLSLTREHVRRYRFLFGLAAALFLLVILHLIPLPASVWASLPGRDIIADIDRAAQLGEVWRPLSMVPLVSWNALYALFVPLAVLLLAVQLTRDEHYLLLPVIICLGLITGMLGLLQVVGARQGPLYFYRITNYGAAVGLFANRNHQAVFLAGLFPMLAVYASSGIRTIEQARLRAGLALAAGLVLVPLLLVTGSRAGLVIGALGLASIPFLYRKPKVTLPARRVHRSSAKLVVLGGVGVIGIALLAVLFGRAEAFSRMMAPDSLEDSRLTFWGPVVDMAWRYFPFGSGIGTFAEAFKINEPDTLLKSTYINHAHNDWLEIYMTGGAPALLLLVAAVVAWGLSTVRAWRGADPGARATTFARLGSVLILMLALASLSDYPLRVPSLACMAVIFAVWLRRDVPRQSAPGIASTKTGGNARESRLADQNHG